ncbi:hypothetical protein DY000_02010318 [Brassica cretica]|uniref:Uncharacterized protein n=1 Tax=Brassica cretica TaxID=69181 RepID=A0ABQ7CLA6_BRACR|nr:hypothetical protein DY000_02010318 [Brassica cretica]
MRAGLSGSGPTTDFQSVLLYALRTADAAETEEGWRRVGCRVRCSPKVDLTVCVWWDLSSFASSVSLPPEALSSSGLFRSDVPAQAMNRGRCGASSKEGSSEFNSVAFVISLALLAAN